VTDLAELVQARSQQFLDRSLLASVQALPG
jgi:hypothetical protein